MFIDMENINARHSHRIEKYEWHIKENHHITTITVVVTCA
jgi:hypothetical protein